MTLDLHPLISVNGAYDSQASLADDIQLCLDAGAARLVKDMLAEFLRDGGAVILTTHILDVAERMAERIGIIGQGRLLAEGTMTELRSHSGQATGSLEDIFLQLVEPEN